MRNISSIRGRISAEAWTLNLMVLIIFIRGWIRSAATITRIVFIKKVTCPDADDEDGINFISPMLPGYEVCFEVTSHAYRDSAFLTGWIDLDGDSLFQKSEQILFKNSIGISAFDMPVDSGFSVERFCFDMPTDATFQGGETHFRFRLSERRGVTPEGREIGGEVEDYWRPLNTIGNYVWRDEDGRGDQNEPPSFGIDDFDMRLTYFFETDTRRGIRIQCLFLQKLSLKMA